MVLPEQNKINNVWSSVWKKDENFNASHMFKHRLFLEGFPIFMSHVPKEAKAIIDVGGGSGRYGLALARALPESHVLITDILPESVGKIEVSAKNLELPNVSTKVEDVFALSFPDNSFDMVFCDVVLQHFIHPKDAVSEMARVVKPGGVVILSCVNVWNFHTLFKMIQKFLGLKYRYGYEKSHTHRSLSKLAASSGLEVVSRDGFYVAYGLYRLKYFSKIFAFMDPLSKVINRIVKFLDRFTGRLVSKKFGFEIFIVARKP